MVFLVKENKFIIVLISILITLSSCSQLNKRVEAQRFNGNTSSFNSSKINFKSNKIYANSSYRYNFSTTPPIKTLHKWVTNLQSNKSEIRIPIKKGKHVKHFNPHKPFFITGISVNQPNSSYLSHSEKTYDSLSSNPSIGNVIFSPVSIVLGAALDIISIPIKENYEPSATKYFIETSSSDFILKANPNFTGTETYNLLGFTSYINFNITEFNSGFTGKQRYKKDPIILNNINIYGTYDWLSIALDILSSTKNKNEFKEYMHNFLISFDSKHYYDSFFNKAGVISGSKIGEISEDKAIEIILQNI